MEKLEEELVEKIESLGGEFVPTDQWDNSITHVIAKLQPEKDGLPEKVMGAIAGGKWVLTKVIMVIFLLIFSPPSLSLSNLEVRGEEFQSRQFSAFSPGISEP